MEPRRKRRSRQHRQPTGKSVELTSRDLEIFKLLQRYRYLRSTFLYAFVGGASETRFKERLGHLYHEAGYIDRPSQQWQYLNARYMPTIYENGDKADEALRQHGLPEEDARTWLSRGRMGAHRQFAHSLMICDVLASIELGVRANPDLRFIGWQEIIGKAPEKTKASDNPFQIPVAISYTCPRTKRTERTDTKLTPDGLFGLAYTTGTGTSYRFFALEADRNSMPVIRNGLAQTSYLKKILAYRQVAAEHLYRSHLGLPNLIVLNVTTNDQHMRNIMTLLAEIAGSSQLFLFKTMSSLGSFEKAPAPCPHMLTEPWQRVGFDQFHINQP